LFSALINTLLLTVSLYMLQVYDRVLTTRSLDTLLYLTLVALAALLTLGLLEIARSRLLANASAWLEQRLAPLAVDGSITNSLRGRPYRSEALRDVREIRAFLGGPAMLALFDAPWAPIFIAVIFVLHPLLGFVATGAATGLFALAVLNDLVTRGPLKVADETAMEAARHLEAGNRNAEIVDALGMRGGVLRRWAARHRMALQLQGVASDRGSIIVGASKSYRLAVQVLMLGAGAYLVVQQQLTGGAMIAGSIILARALAPIETAIGTWKQVVGARAAYSRLKAHLAQPPIRPVAMPLPPPRGHLSLEGVGFIVADGRALVRNVSFDLPAGSTLAIIGPSAAGKSTLARLIVGIHPPSMGRVRLDGADVFPQNRERLAKHLGYLPQDVALFSGTVAENISRLERADPAAVVEAAIRAECHEMILSLPLGYDSEIGEGGAHLSGGQRQRIALARALYGNPRLVVLDEPNTHLDGDGEAALTRTIEWLKARRTTTVLITHRATTLARVDRLLMLRSGTVEGFGSSGDVLTRLQRQPVARFGGTGA
jgi:PrtD family type I secretion system ABC transporter